MRKILVAGNWKMYKTTAEAKAFAEEFKSIIANTDTENEVAICAPFTQLVALKEAFEGTVVKVGAQNMHFETEGAFTGEISPAMLTEIGVDYCVLGHSERRQYFAETDEIINKKLHTAIRNNIAPILCVGEVLEEREAGKEREVVGSQIKKCLEGIEEAAVADMVIAYEPVWAIGTGRTATSEQAEEMCKFIRDEIKNIYGDYPASKVRIQYGGSVKPENAAEILGMENIDGALVGGASLIPDKFIEIVRG